MATRVDELTDQIYDEFYHKDPALYDSVYNKYAEILDILIQEEAEKFKAAPISGETEARIRAEYDAKITGIVASAEAKQTELMGKFEELKGKLGL